MQGRYCLFCGSNKIEFNKIKSKFLCENVNKIVVKSLQVNANGTAAPSDIICEMCAVQICSANIMLQKCNDAYKNFSNIENCNSLREVRSNSSDGKQCGPCTERIDRVSTENGIDEENKSKTQHQRRQVNQLNTRNCVRYKLKCEDCTFKSKTVEGMKRHMADEHGIKLPFLFFCYFCPKRFVARSSLLKHCKNAHALEEKLGDPSNNMASGKSYNMLLKPSDLCGSSSESEMIENTKQNQSLKKSYRKYLYFTCYICKEEFLMAPKYENHLKVKHKITDPRIFRCYLCNLGFKRNQHLKVHIASLHEAEKTKKNLKKKASRKAHTKTTKRKNASKVMAIKKRKRIFNDEKESPKKLKASQDRINTSMSTLNESFNETTILPDRDLKGEVVVAQEGSNTSGSSNVFNDLDVSGAIKDNIIELFKIHTSRSSLDESVNETPILSERELGEEVAVKSEGSNSSEESSNLNDLVASGATMDNIAEITNDNSHGLSDICQSSKSYKNNTDMNCLSFSQEERNIPSSGNSSIANDVAVSVDSCVDITNNFTNSETAMKDEEYSDFEESLVYY